MKNRIKNKINKGFTIIEVIIVLVIAAIIMLAVFLVVPQLQRTQRNTKAQGDVRRVAAAGESYAANSGGLFPDCSAGLYSNCTKLFDITGAVIAPSGTAYSITVTGSAVPATNNMFVLSTASCNASQQPATGGTRWVVAVAQENATGTNTSFCLSN